MGLTAYQFGMERDQAVVALITRLRYMTADQVARCLFEGRRRVAARRLQTLVARGKLRAQRLWITTGPLVFWTPPRSRTRAIKEGLAVAELYCCLLESCPSHVKLDRFDVELPHGRLRPDALLISHMHGRYKAAFLEWDNGTMALERVGAKFLAYVAYAQSGEYRRTAWWRPGVDVMVLFAVPAARKEALTRLSARLSVDLAPIIVSHRDLYQDPWSILNGD